MEFCVRTLSKYRRRISNKVENRGGCFFSKNVVFLRVCVPYVYKGSNMKEMEILYSIQVMSDNTAKANIADISSGIDKN